VRTCGLYSWRRYRAETPFQAVRQLGDGDLGRVVDEQVEVIVFAVELAEFGFEVGAYLARDLLAPGEHGVGEHTTPVLGDEDQMDLQVIGDMRPVRT
jgi:hypothetical protein